MIIEQTIEIPASRRITLDVPPEVPMGKVILTFVPAAEDVINDECPECAKHRDPKTGNPIFNAVTLAAFEESKAIMRGDIPARKYKPQELEEAFKDLMSG